MSVGCSGGGGGGFRRFPRRKRSTHIQNTFDRVYQSSLYTPMFDNFLHNALNHDYYTRNCCPSILGKFIKPAVQFYAGSRRLQIDNLKKTFAGVLPPTRFY